MARNESFIFDVLKLIELWLAPARSNESLQRPIIYATDHYRSITTSPSGREQQISRLPTAGGSRGSGS